MAILGPLRALDPVAYLRFASVYKAFSSPDDFEDEIALLRMEQDAAVAGSRSDAVGGRARALCARHEPKAPKTRNQPSSAPADPQTTRRVVGKLRAGCTTSPHRGNVGGR